MFSINTYDINGKHTIMDITGKVLLFETEENAKQYLRDKGCSEDYIDDLSIEEE